MDPLLRHLSHGIAAWLTGFLCVRVSVSESNWASPCVCAWGRTVLHEATPYSLDSAEAAAEAAASDGFLAGDLKPLRPRLEMKS